MLLSAKSSAAYSLTLQRCNQLHEPSHTLEWRRHQRLKVVAPQISSKLQGSKFSPWVRYRTEILRILCPSYFMVRNSRVIGIKRQASFNVEYCFPLNAESVLSADKRSRRSLRYRERLFMKNTILHCINHPDCGWVGLCFTLARD